jgi:hypothetical protein
LQVELAHGSAIRISQRFVANREKDRRALFRSELSDFLNLGMLLLP